MKHLATGLNCFRAIRARLLIWYFLLAICTTGIAVLVTRQIFCNRLDEKAEAALVEEVERFERFAGSEQEVSSLFDQFLDNYVPRENEIILTFIEGDLYKTSQPLSSLSWLDSELIKQWAKAQVSQRDQVTSDA